MPKYPPCFQICGLAKQMHDELASQKYKVAYQRLMNLYSDILCVEMGRKKIPHGEDPKQWLKAKFREGDVYVRQLHGDIQKHHQIEQIHTPAILKMYRRRQTSARRSKTSTGK